MLCINNLSAHCHHLSIIIFVVAALNCAAQMFLLVSYAARENGTVTKPCFHGGCRVVLFHWLRLVQVSFERCVLLLLTLQSALSHPRLQTVSPSVLGSR